MALPFGADFLWPCCLLPVLALDLMACCWVVPEWWVGLDEGGAFPLLVSLIGGIRTSTSFPSLDRLDSVLGVRSYLKELPRTLTLILLEGNYLNAYLPAGTSKGRSEG